MPRPLTSWRSKVEKYFRENPAKGKHYRLDGNDVYCKVCKKIFTFRRTFHLKQHDRTAVHLNNVEIAAGLIDEEPIEDETKRRPFSEELCNALIAADIPILKLKNPVLKEFLEKWCKTPVPSQTTLIRREQQLGLRDRDAFVESVPHPDPEGECFPIKERLCLFCSSNIPDDAGNGSAAGTGPLEENENQNELSKGTFLKGMSVLCRRLRIDERFCSDEEWSFVNSVNFPWTVCCEKCFMLLKELVELHELITKSEVSLRENIDNITASVIESLSTEVEYSVSTCLHFREEIIKYFNARRRLHDDDDNNKQRDKPAAALSSRRKNVVNKLRMRARSTLPSRKSEDVPKSKSSKSNLSAELKRNALNAQVFVKLEKIESVSVNSPGDNFHPSDIDDFVNNCNDNSEEKWDANESDEEFRLRPPRRGAIHGRKRGRPPKQKGSCNEEIQIKRPRGRPPKMPISEDADLSSIGRIRKRGRQSKPNLTGTLKIDAKDRESDEGDLNYQPSNESLSSDDCETVDGIKQSNSKVSSKSRTSSTNRKSLPKTSPNISRRTIRKVNTLLKDDSPYYLKPFSVVDASTGILSLMNCKVRMEPDRLVCMHPSCDFNCEYEYFFYFNAFREMRRHVKLFHRKPIKPSENDDCKNIFDCVYCDAKFEDRTLLVKHIQSEHDNVKPLPSLCEVCSCTLPHNELLDHVISHKNEKEKSVAQATLSSKVRSGRIKDPTNPLMFPCDGCDLVFDNRTSLRSHAVTHVPIELRRQYQCHICPEVLSSPLSLKNHLSVVHFKDDQPHPYECYICGRKFMNKYKTKYEIHMRSHTGELPFICPKCGKGFREKYRLKQHELLHEHATFCCEYCSCVFRTKKYLRRHHLKRHPETVVRRDPEETKKYLQPQLRPDFIGPKLMYPCEPCGRQYIYKSQLITHLKHAHKMFYPNNSDYPNMLIQDHVGTSKKRTRTPKSSSSSQSSSGPSSSFSSEAGQYFNVVQLYR